MTAPRQILPGTTYLVTRRCTQRQFLLRPSAVTNQILGYVLAVAAKTFNVKIHAYCVLSNHVHLVLTDSDAQLPAFERYVGSLVARAVNASLGRWESFWAPASYSAVALVTPADIVAKTAYVLANPVAAGLVKHGNEWPGLWSDPARIAGDPIEFDRPTVFFRSNGPMPASAELELTAPPGFSSPEDFREQVSSTLARVEDEARRGLASLGRKCIGVAKVLAQSVWSRPTSGEPRRGLSPRVATRDKWKRIEALTRLKEFRRAYREAWSAMRAGVRDALFPAGTYLLRILHGVRCADQASVRAAEQQYVRPGSPGPPRTAAPQFAGRTE